MEATFYALKVELPGAPPYAMDYYVVAILNVPAELHQQQLSAWRDGREEPLKSGTFRPFVEGMETPSLPECLEEIDGQMIIFFTTLQKGVGYVTKSDSN